jgi:glycosyltransferase involved in cell wall biosynthesis
MTRPRISFCITTRNRCDVLGETLRNLLGQCGEDCEVVLLDGASTDATREVAEGIAEADPRLRYHRLESNGGVDRDYDRTVGLARGEYCWMMSDDDLLVPGAAARVLEETKKGYAAVVVNARDLDAGMERTLRDRRLPYTEDRVYGPGEDARLFRECARHLSFIPSLVIRRDLWLSRSREPYFGSWFVHVGVLFQSPLPAPCLLVAEPQVLVRNGNVSWSPRSVEIWMFRWPALVWSFDGIGEGDKRAVSAREPWRSPRELLVLRALGSYGPEAYGRLVAPAARTSPLARAAARAISALPGRLVNRCCVLYCRLRQASDPYVLYNLRNSPFG